MPVGLLPQLPPTWTARIIPMESASSQYATDDIRRWMMHTAATSDITKMCFIPFTLHSLVSEHMVLHISYITLSYMLFNKQIFR